MWYLSCLLLVLIIACLTALLGESVLLLIGLKGDQSGPERLALRWLVGSAALMLAAGWMSWCGLAMRGWGPALSAALALASLTLNQMRGNPPAGSLPARWSGQNALILTALLAAHISLWSIWRDNAFTPYNDSLASIGLGEYLQDHAFRETVIPGFGNPVRGITLLFQARGYRMGTHFLLALVQSWLPYTRSVQVFPAIWAWGVWLCTAGVFLAARWLARINRGPALAACVFGAVNLGAPSFSAARGFMNQLYGIAIGLGILAAVSRAAGGTGRWRRWSLLSGILLAALISAYSEIAPFIVLTIVLGLLASVRPRSGWLATLYKGLVMAVTAVAFANVELLRAFQGVMAQVKGISGANVTYTGLQYFETWWGTLPGAFDIGAWDKIVGEMPAGWRWIYGALHIAVLLIAAAGAAFLLRYRRGAGSRLLLANALIFMALAVYFRFFVANPWVIGKMGHSWFLYRVTNYAFPLALIAIAAAGMWGRKALAALITLAAICAVAYLPVHDRLSGLRTESVKLATGSRPDPFGAYSAFADEVARRSGNRPVYIPLSFINDYGPLSYHQEMALYYLYPQTVLSDDWLRWSGVYYTPYAIASIKAPVNGEKPDDTVLTVVPAGDLTAGEQGLPANFVLGRPLPFSIKLDGGWSPPALVSTRWRYTVKNQAKMQIVAAGPGRLELSFRYLCSSAYAKVVIQAPEGISRELPCNQYLRFEPARLEFSLAAGANSLEWILDQAPVAEGVNPAVFLVEELRAQNSGGLPNPRAARVAP